MALTRARRDRIAAIAALLLPRAFLPPFNEGTFTINMLFNPGVSLAESNRVGADRRAADAGGARGQDRRPAHRPRRTRRACRRRPVLRARSRPEAVVADQSRDRSPISARGSRCCRCRSMSASRSRTGSIICCPGVRAEIALKIFGDDLDALRRIGRGAARRSWPRIPGLTDLQVEKQVRIPQLEIRVDYGRAALYGVQPAAVVEQLSRLSNGRVVSRVVDGYRRFDVVMRLPDRLRTTQAARRPPDRNAGGLDSGAADRRHQGDRRARTRSCARTAAAAWWCWPTPTAAPTWPKIVEAIRRSDRVDQAAGRLFHAASKARSRRRRRRAAPSACSRCCRCR